MQTIHDPKATAPHRYIARFYGRTAGALGTHSRYAVEIFADNPEAARLALYQGFEHISALECEEVK